MKIVLVEKGAEGGQPTERSFEKAPIRIGRDPKASDIAFDNSSYRMVSRNHAELSIQNSKWVIIDKNSSFGTFLNGQKLTQPQPISVGNSIQFGKGGPIVHVIWMEADEMPSPESVASTPPSPPIPSPGTAQPDPVAPPKMPDPVAKPQAVSPAPASKPVPSAPVIEFIGATGMPPITISKDRMWLGRDPNGDIVIEAGAAMVSRRHAEIRRQDNEFVLVDNNSFNGTLVNEQRISAPTPLYHNDRIQLGRGGPILKFVSPQIVAPMGAAVTGQRSVSLNQMSDLIGDLPETGSSNHGLQHGRWTKRGAGG